MVAQKKAVSTTQDLYRLIYLFFANRLLNECVATGADNRLLVVIFKYFWYFCPSIHIKQRLLSMKSVPITCALKKGISKIKMLTVINYRKIYFVF